MRAGLGTVLLFAASMAANAQLVVLQPEYCPDVDKDKPMAMEDGPVRISLGVSAKCMASNSKGKTVRIWKYPQQYQRLASPKNWKIAVDNGAGKTSTYDLPHNSVIGVTLEQPDKGDKWKNYRGSSRNPIALTQPVVLFTVRKQDETRKGLKQEHLVWDVTTIDSLSDPETRGAYPLPSGVTDLRIDEVWVWQGLNPIPKKIRFGTGKGRIIFSAQ